MKGFNIIINEKSLNVGVNSGVLVLAFDIERGIHLNGIDISIGQSLAWGNIILKKGDKIRITACNLEYTIPAISVGKIDTQQLVNEYYNLKKILVEKGLLK